MINSKELLEEAKINRKTIFQLNTNNLETTKYILEKCEELKENVILGVSEGAIKYMGGYNVVYSVVKSLINDLNITIKVVLHLDHGSSFDSCRKAVDAGFTSVMIDASKHNLEENIRITSEVVKYAKLRNVTVEGEIGGIGGVEDNVASGIVYANVEDCINYCNETKIDSLAPAVGSVHGFYKEEPNLQFELIKEISLKTNIPLVLHGGTGIPNNDLLKAVDNGISKINVNTELQDSWTKGLRKFLEENKEVYDPRKIISSGEKNMKEAIQNKIELFRR